MSKKNNFEEKTKEYKMKSDFLSLGIIFTVFIGFLAGLYYYDQQNGILKTITEQLMNLF
ncbi:MAG: hypothetical protein KAS78_02365 [Candidatus Pacebacteria bacterium]|nr:hypothetical protein [Candidatus Paceibacterota bacterium]